MAKFLKIKTLYHQLLTKITLYNVLKTTAMVLSLAGNHYVNHKNVLGMYLWLIGSSLWFLLSIRDKNYQQTIMFTAYTYYNIQGVLLWK